ncbi:MAG TPA: PQQ-dependent sugar dehydrogenase [Acidimicrobiia bacterium]
MSPAIRARADSRRNGRVFGARRYVVLAMVVAVIGAFVAVVPRAERAEAASLPSGFTSTAVFSGLTLPTAVAFSPDGKVYVAEKSGIIKVFPNASSNNGIVFKDLSTRTFDFWDRGMLGLTVDPRMGNGTGHDFVYVLYATDAPPGQSPPVWHDDCPTPPGGLTDGCIVTSTLSRIPVNSNGTSGAEQILISNEWCQQFTTHSAGHLAFGPDGNLYVSGGDGGSYENADWGQFGGSLPNSPTPVNPCGDPPGGKGVANTSPTGRGGAMRSQSPRRPAGEARVLSGTVLRLNPDTGAGVSGNPMFNASSPSANSSRILAYGMRNPFRFTVRPNTNELWVADVGWGIYEEINRIPTLTPAKAPNFGWPCVEDQTHLSGYRDLDMCKALYNDTVDPPTDPYFAYEHGQKVNGNDTCGFADGTAITGVAFYTGNRYPSSYANSLFFADDVRNCIYVMTAGANGLPDTSTARTFVDDSDNPAPVDLEVDPASKDIFYVNIAQGTVNRISYTSSNRAPVASATATPTSGAAPLSVQLNGSASSDPDGDALTYSWDTDGNGSFGDATGKTPTVSYASGGTYHPRLLVTDPGGLSNTSSALTVTVTSAAGPTNTAAPVIGGTFQVGSTVLGGTGTWTGAAPITYVRQWQRCTTSAGSTCTDIGGATASTYSLQLADQGKHIRERVTATNAGGTSSAASTLHGPVIAGTNAPPTPVIDTPAATLTWKSGDTVSFSGHATDPQDGTEPASRLSWNLILGHCTNLGCHTHPLTTRTGIASGTIAAPDHQAPSYIQLTLTATDASGATASVVRRIDPKTVNLTFKTTPAGLSLAVGAEQSAPAPFTQEWVVGSQVQLNAPTQQTVGGTAYTFSGWSAGGAATHTEKAPASNTTYTANYTSACSGSTYASAVLANNPWTYWRLGDKSGTTAADASPNARPGTYAGGVGLLKVGAIAGDKNASVSLDGANDNIIRKGITNFPTTAISAELWLKTSDTTKEAGIVSYAASSSADEFQLRDYRNLRVYVKGAVVTTGVALNDNQWHHLVVTWKSNGGSIRVYKDGALAYKNTIPVQAGTSLTGGGALVLGQEQDSVGGGFDPAQAFLGKLDEFALYRKVLAAAEAKADHDAGATAPVCGAAKAASVRAQSASTPRLVPGSEFLPSLPRGATSVSATSGLRSSTTVTGAAALAAAEPVDADHSWFCPLLGRQT